MVAIIKKLLNSKKLIFSVISQLLTLLVSIIITVGVTKFISVESYGYWQLFIFYSSYVGMAHFGICDGLYLVYGGKKLEDIDKKELKGVFYVFFIIQLIIITILLIYTSLFQQEEIRKYILYAISLLLLVSNSQIFFGYILLSTNKIIEYSKSVILEKIIFFVLILGSIFLDKIGLDLLIFSYILSKIISLMYLSKFYKSLFFANPIISKNYIYDLIKSGGILMISNIVSTLILGVGRYFIDKNWDIKIFGKISLAIALVYFVLILLSQISFLLFPVLRNSTVENQKDILQKLNKNVSLVLKISIICYFPLIFVLEYLLPNYLESIHYLILLLPLCLYDGKMQIIYASFFKNLFLQKQLLKINISSLILSLIIVLIGSYWVKNIDVVLLGIVTSIVFRSIVSELVLNKKYQIKDLYSLLTDISFSLAIIFYFFINFNIYILISLLVIITFFSSLKPKAEISK